MLNMRALARIYTRPQRIAALREESKESEERRITLRTLVTLEMV